MKNKVKVTINDMDFTLVSEESEEYMQKVAALVDGKIAEVTAGATGISTLASVILAAANIADDYIKLNDTASNLRDEIKDYFDQVSSLKDENAELRRELARLAPDASKTPAWEERQSKLDLGEDDEN